MKPLEVVVVSDIICPWCFIGSRRLKRVLQSHKGLAPRIEYRPFLLDPSIPPEGADLRQRLRRKYGRDPEPMFERVVEAARAEDIPLDYSRIRRTPNTINAHTLIRHAKAKGTQPELAEALHGAYFLEGRDISKLEELESIAVRHGFDPGEASLLLASEDEREQTTGEAIESAEAGVDGVPFFIFGRKIAFSGAQPDEIFEQAIQRAL